MIPENGRMKELSLIRQISIEDISEPISRRDSVGKKIELNKPPKLEEVDERIGQLIDIVVILEQSLNKLEQEDFQEVREEESITVDVGLDEGWRALHPIYHHELHKKDREYEALLKGFSAQGVASPARSQWGPFSLLWSV
jgi:hypothetical protein